MIKLHFSRDSSLTVIVPVLRTLGNIVAGDDAQTQVEKNNVSLSSHSSESLIFLLCGQGVTLYLGA